MISAQLLELVRCPDCRGRIRRDPGAPQACCQSCLRAFDASGECLDLRPRDPHAEQTKYLDEALHADARHATTAPPVLSAAIRHDMLQAFLRPAPGDRVIDLGCGSGKALIWNGGRGAYQVGVDVSPYFSREARESVDLVLGDLRQLPFADASFTKAYALDVLEHLSRDSLDAMLREASRILTPGGQLFVYSHVRKNSLVAGGLKAINRLARALERRGLVDLEHERLRKSDHLNPLADIPDLRNTTAAAGFEVARLRYYTPLVGGFVENILVRMGERLVTTCLPASASSSWLPALAGRRTAHLPPRIRAIDGVSPLSHRTAEGGSHEDARAAIKQRIARRGPTYIALRALTLVMKIDLVLFGRIESGPFFALLRKK